MDELTQFVCESWSLFAAAVLFTLMRLFARVRQIGFNGLQVDDYLAFIALLSFSGELGIAHTGGSMFYKAKAAGQLLDQTETALQNPAALKMRALAYKLQFALGLLYTTTLWLLKASLLALYLRLTKELSGRYRSRVFAGFGFLAVSWVAIILTTFLGCRPFHEYFNPDPNKSTLCQPAVSPAILYTCYALNVLTDIWLISIPLPMVSKLMMRPWKKIGLALLFSLGAVVVVFATTRCVLITTVPKEGPVVGSRWAIRETFVAIITANFPMAFSLIKEWLGPAFRSIWTLSSHTADGQHRHHRQQSDELETIGATGRSRKFRRAGDPTKRDAFFELESEARTVSRESVSVEMDPAPESSGRHRSPIRTPGSPMQK